MLSGCCVLTQFKVINLSGQNIEIYSTHTKKITPIENEKSKSISHTAGNIRVKFANGMILYYGNLSPLDFMDTPYIINKRNFLCNSITVKLCLYKDNKIYVVIPGNTNVNVQQLEQPNGFPIIPVSKPKLQDANIGRSNN